MQKIKLSKYKNIHILITILYIVLIYIVLFVSLDRKPLF